MKTLLTFALICLAAATFAQDVTVPKGIIYKKASQAVNNKAYSIFLYELKNSGDSIFDKLCYVGPILWVRYQKYSTLNNIPGGKITFNAEGKQISEQQLDGKLIQKKEDFRMLWSFVKSDMSGTVSFKKLSPNQLRYYWAVNFYDIEEPVFIADNGLYKLLIQFSPTTNKILWIDEVFD